LEELNQKWILHKRNYFRGAKGVLKGRLNRNQIENDVYARETGIDRIIEGIDEYKLFDMNRVDYERMMNIKINKKSLKRKSNQYRNNNFQIIFEFKFRLIICMKLCMA
jgi:hypothetical protein